MSDDLKPCPFCGGDKNIICRTDYDGGDAYAVSCRYSDCHGHIFTLGHGYFSTKEEAIAAWNTRADKDRIEQLAATCEQLERDKVLDDGRPCVTDVFLAAAIEQLDDKWDLFEAVKCWCEGDWEGALEGIELEGKE